jgi:hypothetical protein
MKEKYKLGTRVAVKNSGNGTVVAYEDKERIWVFLDDFMEADVEYFEDITVLKEEKPKKSEYVGPYGAGPSQWDR